MKSIKPGILWLCLMVGFTSCQPSLSGPELVKKSIQYHDPKDEWKNINHLFYFSDTRPDKSSRHYQVSIDVSENYFRYINESEELVYEISKEKCLSDKPERPDCERGLMLRDYYMYLWGLPMKLLDPGTAITEEYQRETIEGIEAYVVQVPYEKDVWYFYLHPENYSLIAYKFYKDEPKAIGEIIYLEGEINIGEMKIPAKRSWYRTENDEFLGTDFLLKTEASSPVEMD